MSEPYPPGMTSFTNTDVLERIYQAHRRNRVLFERARLDRSEGRMETCAQQDIGLLIAMGIVLAHRSNELPTQDNDLDIWHLHVAHQWVEWRASQPTKD